ncbi:MAG TPA: hypothetical protein VM677_11895 [Actinokineospora sp.]|nr:hypothetical protein [Actinokineospora sp.]
MDPAWVAVVGTAIGATGATGAAALSGWSARRQDVHQHAGQRSQWQHEKRRDAYSGLLDAGVQARDELAAVWSLLKARDRDPAVLQPRVDALQPLVDAVKRASEGLDSLDFLVLLTRAETEFGLTADEAFQSGLLRDVLDRARRGLLRPEPLEALSTHKPLAASHAGSGSIICTMSSTSPPGTAAKKCR